MATVNISSQKAPAGAKAHTFRSRHGALRLIRKSTRELRDSHGALITREEGVKYPFQNGVLTVYEGQDKLPDGYDTDKGEVVEQDAVSWLRNHPNLDSSTTGGFFEEGREPGRPLPTEEDVLDEITGASARMDAEGLRAVIRREEATHNRKLLLKAAQGALETVEAHMVEELHVGQLVQQTPREGDVLRYAGDENATAENARVAELRQEPWQNLLGFANALGIGVAGVGREDLIAQIVERQGAQADRSGEDAGDDASKSSSRSPATKPAAKRSAKSKG